MINKRKSYTLINLENNKIVRYLGKLQYFRTKASALGGKPKIEKTLKIKIKIEKC